MPRAHEDYYDPSVEAIDDNKIDFQIDNLFKEYQNQKLAYKNAFKLRTMPGRGGGDGTSPDKTPTN